MTGRKYLNNYSTKSYLLKNLIYSVGKYAIVESFQFQRGGEHDSTGRRGPLGTEWDKGRNCEVSTDIC